MDFANRLKDLRATEGLTQDELAKKTGLTKSAISMYELGVREPRYEVLEILADHFNVDMNYLLGKEERSTYYLSPEAAKLAQELHDNPNGKLLKGMLDSTKGMKPESIKEVMRFIEYQKAKENHEDKDK